MDDIYLCLENEHGRTTQIEIRRPGNTLAARDGVDRIVSIKQHGSWFSFGLTDNEALLLKEALWRTEK